MAITYSISGGADATKFNIDGASGALAFKKAPDYEKPTDPETGDANGDHVYEVTVRATDATGLVCRPSRVKVTVTDVSEGSPPQITSAGAIQCERESNRGDDRDSNRSRRHDRAADRAAMAKHCRRWWHPVRSPPPTIRPLRTSSSPAKSRSSGKSNVTITQLYHQASRR